MDDEYRIPAKCATSEIKVQGSRFIGEVMPSTDLSDALEQLEKIRNREYAATHHCFAYRIGHDGPPQDKYSDDGEPNGTAGRPIYDALVGARVTDTLLVVTRYFGGTKLGTGGLAHAYAECASGAIDRAGILTRYITRRAVCTLQFPLYDRWLKLITKLGATMVDSRFTSNVVTTVEVRRSKFEELQRAFIELTAGKGRFEPI